jgi:hypothetical protein
MLFMDFARQRRVRINGTATILEANEEIREVWPMAQGAVLVTVEQAYGNCSARIPRMDMVERSDRRRQDQLEAAFAAIHLMLVGIDQCKD